jgi:hypothetical protein
MKGIIKQNIRLAPTRFFLDVVLGDYEFFKEVLKSDKYYEEGAFDFEEVEISKSSEGAIWTLIDKVSEEDDKNDVTKFLMWVKDKDDVITISHEAIHITWEINRYTNIRIAEDAQEFQCYMHDYIMEQVLSLMKS